MKREILPNALRVGALTLLTLLVVGSMAHAQIQLDTQATIPPDEPPLQPSNGAIELSLEEAVEIALRRNLGLVIERFTRTQARLGVDQTLGIYDLVATGELFSTDETSPTVSQFEASETQIQRATFVFDQAIPTGGLLTFGWINSRSEISFNNVNPAYNSDATFSFTQPLLRDFGRSNFERELLVARTQNDRSSQEFRRQVIASLQQVTDAYWALVEAKDQLVVARESLKLATDLHERNRIQVDVGTLAPLELVQSEAAIATREEDIIRAQQAVGDAEDTLRRLLNLPPGPLWETEIRPETLPEVERAPLDIDAAIATALQERPEIRAQQTVVEQARIEAAFNRNQKLPSLDLNLSYGLSGAGGDLLVRDETGNVIRVIPGGFGDAFDQVTGLGFGVWTARLTFGYPLQNRAARAASAIADLALEQQETVLDDIEQQITTEVRQAARQVDSAAKQIDAARASVRFQELTLDAEKKRYENGMSSSFNITRIQQDVTAARSRQVTAIIAYRTALTRFQQATGQLLSTYNVAIDDPEQPIDRWSFNFFGGQR